MFQIETKWVHDEYEYGSEGRKIVMVVIHTEN